jgi:excinuclease ABC subunit C
MDEIKIEPLLKQAQHLPMLPGVYLFKDGLGKVLYVGKAKILRQRVRSYFLADIGRGPGIDQMVQASVLLDHQVTSSETEALILEARLIRQFKPKYNIRLRDDKSFALIRIDWSDPFPPIYISREKDLLDSLARLNKPRVKWGKINQRAQSQEFFGPYLSARSVKLALQSIRKIWPFRDCSSVKYSRHKQWRRGCVFADLGLCAAPCVAGISTVEYQRNLEQIRSFLQGEKQKVLNDVQKEMEKAAAAEQYERAALLRDRLEGLRQLREAAFQADFATKNNELDGDLDFNPLEDLYLEAYDISHNQGALAVGSMVVGIIKGGKLSPITKDNLRARFSFLKKNYRKFKVSEVTGSSDVDSLKEVLTRRLIKTTWQVPDFILIDGGKTQLAAVLSVQQGLSDPERSKNWSTLLIGSVAKGISRKKVDLYGQDWSKLFQLNDEARLLLAEMLREEAHRFGIEYYRWRHRKDMLK